MCYQADDVSPEPWTIGFDISFSLTAGDGRPFGCEWFFSVDGTSLGAAGGDLSVFAEAQGEEAAGDVFWLSEAGANMVEFDEGQTGLASDGAPPDDVDALDLEADVALDGTGHLPAGKVLFSLASGSPSLTAAPGGPYAGGDILMSDGNGGFVLYMWAETLGISGEDLDALFVDSSGQPFFSVARGGPGGYSPADVFSLDGFSGGASDGQPDLVVQHTTLGLLETDDLNALDVRTHILPGHDPDGDGLPTAWEERYGLDPANPDDADEDPDSDGLVNYEEYDHHTDPTNGDTDGDSLPDGWEVSHGLLPRDPTGDNGADGDPDLDGLTNYEEYLRGTDPHEPSPPVPALGWSGLAAAWLATSWLAAAALRRPRGVIT